MKEKNQNEKITYWLILICSWDEVIEGFAGCGWQYYRNLLENGNLGFACQFMVDRIIPIFHSINKNLPSRTSSSMGRLIKLHYWLPKAEKVSNTLDRNHSWQLLNRTKFSKYAFGFALSSRICPARTLLVVTAPSSRSLKYLLEIPDSAIACNWSLRSGSSSILQAILWKISG